MKMSSLAGEMAEQITLTLPDLLAQQVREVAALTQQSLEEVLLEWLQRGSQEPRVASLPDERVLALCDAELPPQEQEDLSQLLAKQREKRLLGDEADRLEEILQRYRRGMTRKAEAWKVAVERGLRPSLDSVV
ncbi:MAG: hypothetical protein SVX43_12460 [Cyanobacteriota bacterium]|nr:hypothetical protein [Cyanobacteriota bacterium]